MPQYFHGYLPASLSKVWPCRAPCVTLLLCRNQIVPVLVSVCISKDIHICFSRWSLQERGGFICSYPLCLGIGVPIHINIFFCLPEQLCKLWVFRELWCTLILLWFCRGKQTKWYSLFEAVSQTSLAKQAFIFGVAVAKLCCKTSKKGICLIVSCHKGFLFLGGIFKNMYKNTGLPESLV